MKLESVSPDQLTLLHRSWFAILAIPVLVVAGLVALVLGFVQNQRSYLYIGGFVLVAGLIVAVFYRTIRIVCDRRTKLMTISKRGIFGNGGDRVLPFSDVKEVLLEESFNTQRTGDGERRLRFFLVFVLQNGRLEQYDVTPAMQSSSGGDVSAWRYEKHNELIDLVRRLADFLGVPFRDRMAPTLGDAMEAVEKIAQAIKQGKG